MGALVCTLINTTDNEKFSSLSYYIIVHFIFVLFYNDQRLSLDSKKNIHSSFSFSFMKFI